MTVDRCPSLQQIHTIAGNEEKKLHAFLYSTNMANFEAFFGAFFQTENPEFVKRVLA